MQEFEYNGKAMGTEYSVAVVCGSKELADKAYEIARGDIESYEARFSRFLPTSELSVLNEKKDMVVSQTFLDATLKARQLFAATGGVFNPLVQIARFGYNKTFNDIKDGEGAKDDSPYDIDFSSTIIDRQTSRVRLSEGQKLDYGCFLKGYLAEIIAKKLESHFPDIAGVIVNLGGDIHARGLDQDGNKFVFNIHNPVQENGDIEVTLYNQSLATSGTYKRSWLSSGKKTHHILDASGARNPENDIVSASVIHEDGAAAEAYAKVFLSLGHGGGLKLLDGKDIPFVIIKSDRLIIRNTI
jgi:thiamine biosynthesis lipoprotein